MNVRFGEVDTLKRIAFKVDPFQVRYTLIVVVQAGDEVRFQIKRAQFWQACEMRVVDRGYEVVAQVELLDESRRLKIDFADGRYEVT